MLYSKEMLIKKLKATKSFRVIGVQCIDLGITSEQLKLILFEFENGYV